MLSNTFLYGNWKLIENKSHILKLEGDERNKFEDELRLPMYPDMIFNSNTIEIRCAHDEDCKITFNVMDALKLVPFINNQITVAAADVWQEANAHILKSDIVDQPNEVLKAKLEFDWTFTTKYAGSLVGNWKINETDEKINYDILKEKEPILFYSEMSLFEDELGDNGCVQLMIRLRVMKSGIFLLLRFFLRVDGRLIRVFDTRLCCGAAVGSNDYFLREIRHKESSEWSEKLSGICMMEAEAYCDKTILNYCEKLIPC